jgi:STAS domain-containing protein
LVKPSASRSASVPPDRVKRDAGLVVCDASAVSRPDFGTVDALARVALVAGRLGCRIQVQHAAPELRNLLALAGLADVVPCVEASGLESRGHAEQREELLGVEEERDGADAVSGEL